MKTIDKFEPKIYTIRGVKVMLDRDLAPLYGVTTGNLNLAVKRNAIRFPDDFMFQLSKEDWESLTLQFAILKSGRGQHRKYLPYAFTEHGVAMLSSVLKSDTAALINIRIMRAFVELRRAIAVKTEFAELKEKVARIESQILVDGIIRDKKMADMSADIRRISETLDNFQDGYIVIKRQ